LEEARLAREAAKAAEEQRVAAIKAAEEATKAANDAISIKRDTERHTDPEKVAALPKLEQPHNTYDGAWTIVRIGPSCRDQHVTIAIRISGSAISGYAGSGALRGSISTTGAFHFTHPSNPGGQPKHYSGTMKGAHGSGTFIR
jgi:hypothetical protein